MTWSNRSPRRTDVPANSRMPSSLTSNFAVIAPPPRYRSLGRSRTRSGSTGSRIAPPLKCTSLRQTVVQRIEGAMREDLEQKLARITELAEQKQQQADELQGQLAGLRVTRKSGD